MLSHILRWTPNPDSQPPCTDFVLLHFLRAFDVSQRGHGWMTWFPYEGHTATLSIWPTSRSKRSDLHIAGHLKWYIYECPCNVPIVPSRNTNDKHTLGYYLGMKWGDQRECGPARGSSRWGRTRNLSRHFVVGINLGNKHECDFGLW